MNNKEALEILEHNWTKLVNPDCTDEELGQALDLAIKALQFAEEVIKITIEEDFPEYTDDRIRDLVDKEYNGD